MTATRKDLIRKLLRGYYLVRWMLPNRLACFRLYDPKGNPVKNVQDKTVRTMDRFIDPAIRIWKKGKHGKKTLNLSMVRRLHGGNTIKKLYKESRQ